MSCCFKANATINEVLHDDGDRRATIASAAFVQKTKTISDIIIVEASLFIIYYFPFPPARHGRITTADRLLFSVVFWSGICACEQMKVHGIAETYLGNRHLFYMG